MGLLDRSGVPEEARLGRGVLPGGGRAARVRVPVRGALAGPEDQGLVKGLQDQVKDQGLWAIFLDEELGGPGYGQLKLGLLNEILGRYPSAPQMFGAAAPDTGNMEMLAAYGTERAEEALARADAQPGACGRRTR